MTCPVCEGKREVTGILVPGAFRDDPSGQTWATIYCPNDCHRGTVPAMPKAQEGLCVFCGKPIDEDADVVLNGNGEGLHRSCT